MHRLGKPALCCTFYIAQAHDSSSADPAAFFGTDHQPGPDSTKPTTVIDRQGRALGRFLDRRHLAAINLVPLDLLGV